MSPFRVFVSSPVDGIEDFRIAVMKAARAAENSRKFQFFFYENFENERLDGKTICESIFVSSGENFDALFVFFRDRVGAGTMEELDYFENAIMQRNPNCKIWWSQIFCNERSEGTKNLTARLLKYSTGLPILPGDEKIERPSQLAGRLTAKLWSLVDQMPSQSDAK